MKAREFRARAERQFRRANPDIADVVEIEWRFTSRPLSRNGVPTGRTGSFIAKAPGYRSRLMMVDVDPSGFMVVR